MKDGNNLNKWFTVTWVLLFILIGLVAYALVRDYNRQPDVNNYIGKSAYQIAAEHGYVGSEIQWLSSLKADPVEGPKGDKGDSVKGKDGKDSVSTTTTKETETIIEKQVAVKGEDGRTPEIAQDITTKELFIRYTGDDDWHIMPKLCLSVLCGDTHD